MTWQGWLSLSTALACLAVLGLTRLSAEVVLLGGAGALLLAGVLTPAQALGGFANEGVATIAVMFIVVAGLRETGAMDAAVRFGLGRPSSERGAVVRLTAPTAIASSVMNNTPLVATMLPVVISWARRLRMPASLLLLPLSHAAVLGGMVTLIGTSTNLVVDGLMAKHELGRLGLFELAWVGVPMAAAGIVYLVLAAPRLLRGIGSADELFADPREYTVEMGVTPGGPLDGRTIEQAGLRALPGLFLIEIVRDDYTIAAPGPVEQLRGGDTLVFAGAVASVVDLQRIKGLAPTTERQFRKGEDSTLDRWLVEVVVSTRCPAIGQSIRDSRFRVAYGASIIAVARDGRRLPGKVGDVRLQAGDTLLLAARPGFIARLRALPDFLLVSELQENASIRHERSWLAWLILGAVVLTATTGVASLFVAAVGGAAAMLLTGCLTLRSARRAVDVGVLIAIAGALAIAQAMDASGADERIGQVVVAAAQSDPMFLLVAVYLSCMLMSELLSNNAVAAMMFPVVLGATQVLGVSPTPYMVALMISCSAAFASPLGYQSTLMVYGPGGYRLADVVRFGAPLNLVCFAVSMAIIPLVWPLT